MIFVDSNIPMYLVGDSEVHRTEARRLIAAAIDAEERLVCDAEVLQEILHRYVAIGRRDAIGPAFDALTRIVDEVFPIELRDVESARRIVLGSERLSARDAVHVASMKRHGLSRIMSFDRGFDGYPGVRRLGP